MTEPNAPLLLKTLAHIENHPEEWNQESWRCGTTACFAGHAAMLDGGEWLAAGSNLMVARKGEPNGIRGSWVHVEDRARHVLGLTYEQARRLFDGGNTLNELRAEVYRLAGDWDRLAELAEDAATAANNGQPCNPSAYADPAYDLDTKHALWIDLMDAIREWDGDTDKRHLVVDAVHKLIGRP